MSFEGNDSVECPWKIVGASIPGKQQRPILKDDRDELLSMFEKKENTSSADEQRHFAVEMMTQRPHDFLFI